VSITIFLIEVSIKFCKQVFINQDRTAKAKNEVLAALELGFLMLSNRKLKHIKKFYELRVSRQVQRYKYGKNSMNEVGPHKQVAKHLISPSE